MIFKIAISLYIVFMKKNSNILLTGNILLVISHFSFINDIELF